MAQQQDAAPRPRVGLVLSGGGARGAAHVGVLKVLEELRVPVDLIAANSMGALVGGCYAYGLSPDELERVLRGIDWGLLLTDRNRRTDLSFRRKEDDVDFPLGLELGLQGGAITLPRGLTIGHYAQNIVRLTVRDSYRLEDFDELNVPFRAVATDIGTGEQVVLGSGGLAEAMSASMAIPGMFAPVRVDGRNLVDGMIVNNVPVDIVKAMGADVVIAVDIGTPLLEAEQVVSLLQVTGQMVGILMQRNIDERLALLTEQDLLLQPDLGDISSSAFDRWEEAMAIGEAAARAVADELRRFSLSEPDYAVWRARQRRAETPPPVLREIAFANSSGLADARLRSLMTTQPGDRLDEQALQRDLDRLFGLRDFDRVVFELEPVPGDDAAADLRIVADARSWGPSYLRFGLDLADNFRGDSAYGIGAQLTVRPINRLGAEWRTVAQVGERMVASTEFFQPLDTHSMLFVAPLLEHEQFPAELYENGQVVTDLDVMANTAGLDIGALLGNWGQLRLGLRRLWADVDVEFSSVPTPDRNIDDVALRLGLQVDTLDDAFFPRRGVAVQGELLSSSTELGADDAYSNAALNAIWAQSLGHNTLVLGVGGSTTLDGPLPIYRQPAYGGFLRGSGLYRRELLDEHGLLLRAIAFRQLTEDQVSLIDMPVYVGGSLEYGGVAAARGDLDDAARFSGSVFLGVDSILGPFYLAYGMYSGGRSSFYMFLGNPFR